MQTNAASLEKDTAREQHLEDKMRSLRGVIQKKEDALGGALADSREGKAHGSDVAKYRSDLNDARIELEETEFELKTVKKRRYEAIEKVARDKAAFTLKTVQKLQSDHSAILADLEPLVEQLGKKYSELIAVSRCIHDAVADQSKVYLSTTVLDGLEEQHVESWFRAGLLASGIIWASELANTSEVNGYAKPSDPKDFDREKLKLAVEKAMRSIRGVGNLKEAAEASTREIIEVLHEQATADFTPTKPLYWKWDPF